MLLRNCREMCRKDLLVKNLKRQKRQLLKVGRIEEAHGYNFWPTSFVLPVRGEEKEDRSPGYSQWQRLRGW